MRVIAGTARGVPLIAPRGGGNVQRRAAGDVTRPTTDKIKGAIFNALGDRGCSGRVLDLFAGSGALGIEALSRGADFCDFVDASPAACRTIEANLAKTKLAAQASVHGLPVARFVARAMGHGTTTSQPYDLLLLDPPYALAGLEELLASLAASSLVHPGSAVLVEHDSRRLLPEALGPLRLSRRRDHGDSGFSLYLAAPSEDLAQDGLGKHGSA